MNKKKTSKDYDYYTMKLPKKLSNLFEKYIRKHETLGFKNVSQFALHILQKEAIEILKEDPDLEPHYEKKDNKKNNV